LTKPGQGEYIAYMAKFIVRANVYGNQVRISIPSLILKQLGWRDSKYFLVEKVSQEEIRVRKILSGRDMK